MIHFLYKTTNMIDGKFYIGVHSTANPDDGYIGSGKRLWHAIRKHGIEHFTREILETFDDECSMYQKERLVVDEAFVARRDTYNIAIGGHGGNVIRGFSDDELKTHRAKFKGPQTKEHCLNISIARTGIRISEDQKTIISQFQKGRSKSEDHKTKIGDANRGKKRTPEQNAAQSIAMKAMSTSGADNSNAKTYIIQSPDGDTYKIIGGLKSFCRESKLISYDIVRQYCNKGAVPIGKYTGWQFTEELPSVSDPAAI